MSIRPACKAGAWYSADARTLRAEVGRMLDAAGDGAPLSAGIVPHAGLAYSGPTAARVFVRAQASGAETILLFGAVHTVRLRRPALWSEGAWETPLGRVEVDEELARLLLAAGLGDSDEAPHREDNAIELQLPLLKAALPEARIVPVAVPPTAEAAQVGVAAEAVCRRTGKKIIALGSTDLTHYGRGYGFAPVGEGPEALAWSRGNDRKLLDLLLSMRAEEVVPRAAADRSACGAGAAAAACAFARAAGCREGELLEHITSHEVRPDGPPRQFVGYAAIAYPS